MDAGLTHILADTPVRSGFAEFQAGLAQDAGAYLRGELGYRPWENVAAYAFAQASTREAAMAGVGVRVEF